MNKVKLLLSVVVALSVLISCGDTDGLDKRLDIIEEGLGADEPIKATFTTTNDNAEEITENGPFIFERNMWDAVIYDYGDGIYTLYVRRYSNLTLNNTEGFEGITISFDYDANTKEVGDDEVALNFSDKNGQYRYAEFRSDDDNITFSITVKTFDTETGKIDLTFEGTSESAYENNAYVEKPMSIKGSYKAQLPILTD